MIKPEHYAQFADTFNRELSHYVDYTGGFNVTKFNAVLGVKDDQSLIFYLESAFGQSAADLVNDMLHYPRVEGINTDLSEVLDGKRHDFNIHETIVGEDDKKGRIFYPFGMHRSGQSYEIWHLPSGYSITHSSKTIVYERNAQAFCKELQAVNGAEEASPDSKVLDALKAIVNRF